MLIRILLEIFIKRSIIDLTFVMRQNNVGRKSVAFIPQKVYPVSKIDRPLQGFLNEKTDYKNMDGDRIILATRVYT